MQLRFKQGNVQPCRLRVSVEILRFQILLVFEQQVVHYPELTLLGSGLRRFSGLLGKRMLLHQRKMPKHEAQLMRESHPEGFDPAERVAAEGTLEIAIGDEGHRCRIRPDDMVVRPQGFGLRSARQLIHLRVCTLGLIPGACSERLCDPLVSWQSRVLSSTRQLCSSHPHAMVIDKVASIPGGKGQTRCPD